MKNQKNTIKTNNTQDKKTTQEDLINTNRLNIRYKYKPFSVFIGNYSFIEWGVYCYLDTPFKELQTFIKNDVFKYLELKKC